MIKRYILDSKKCNKMKYIELSYKGTVNYAYYFTYIKRKEVSKNQSNVNFYFS